MGETRRAADPVREELVKRGAGQHLEQAPGDHEARVAIGPELARSMDEADVAKGVDVALDGVVSPTEPLEVVALYSACMGEQMPGGDLAGGRVVSQAEARQVALHRGVEVDGSAVDELHYQRGGEQLRVRADLEDRIRGRLHVGVGVHDPGDEVEQLVPAADGKRGAGHPVLARQGIQPLLDLGQPSHELRHGRSVPVLQAH